MRNLAGLLLLVALMIGLLTGMIWIGLVFWVLFLLPFVPWAQKFSDDWIEQTGFCFAVGLAFVPAIYFLFGMLKVPLNLAAYTVPSFIILTVGMFFCRKKKMIKPELPVHETKVHS